MVKNKINKNHLTMPKLTFCEKGLQKKKIFIKKRKNETQVPSL